ncbi:hypothetical protein [Capillibacterium thermochitinicola]|uniref:Transporter n=1 Tax=Capillibacterium thermochitinicola TaxID=2699427 RepID=A0A8J6I289_9FIRM|nr:hypothetical protein [Capillibacterium thermochitinicola]MBA2132937.1 hypothetical protein [Capillibacterium thermochitinicola]
MRKFAVVLFLVLCGILAATPVWAVEAGGRVKFAYSGTWVENGDFSDELNDHLDLELYLPPVGKTELSYAFRVGAPFQGLLAGEEATYFTKKLYLKHRFSRFHLTVGRQPVSWSFGSMLNPVDYTIGAEALETENQSKYTDAVEAYLPLNWNSGLALVASFPTGFDLETEKMKWGVRGRFGVKGYDLTINYVQEPETAGPGGHGQGWPGLPPFPRQRVGLTFKGDLGPIGVYGAYGRYFGGEPAQSNSYLLGVDYSYNVDYYRKLTMQLEYLGLDGGNLAQLLGPLIMMGSGKERTNLLTGTLAYPIDDFSVFSLTAIASLGGDKYLVMPSYQNTLPGNIDLDLNCEFYLRESKLESTSIAVGLSYSF